MHYSPPQSNFRGGHVPRVPRGIYAYGRSLVDDAKCIVVTCVTVRLCVSVCPRPHAHTTARTRMKLGVVARDAP